MKKILITEFMDANSINNLKNEFDVYYDSDLYRNIKKILDVVDQYEALIVRNKTLVNKDLLLKAERLKIIGRLGVGLDNIDTKLCEENNIKVQPAIGMNATSVAEYVMACSLSLIKNLTQMNQATLQGEWPRTTIKPRELKGKILGLLGFGTIGKEVSLLAQAFGMHVVVYDPFINKSNESEFNINLINKEELFNKSDIISIHVPLSSKTKNLINRQSFLKMKKKPLIINTSRGSIVDEEGLLQAYKNNLISGFALDVYKEEPVQKAFYSQIDNRMNCILTPHIAGVTNESNKRVSDYIVEKISSFFRK